MFDPLLLYQVLTASKTFFLIAGPCVIEQESLMMHTAETLKKISEAENIPLIFKSSYTKANRTSGDSFSGPGIEQGLKILAQIKKEFTLPIITDVHETSEVCAVAEVADIIQIPAFLCRQTALIITAGQTGKIINLKKGQFLAPEDMTNQVDKVLSTDNHLLLLTERGSSFGYHNLVVDFRSFPIMHKMKFPIVFDATHSMQKPSISKTSGGSPEYTPMMAQAAIATGFVQGLFLETHPNPSAALSDSNTQFPLASMEKLVHRCVEIQKVSLRTI